MEFLRGLLTAAGEEGGWVGVGWGVEIHILCLTYCLDCAIRIRANPAHAYNSRGPLILVWILNGPDLNSKSELNQRIQIRGGLRVLLQASKLEGMHIDPLTSVILIFQESGDNKCQCPSGFKGDGTKTCEGNIFWFYIPFFFLIWYFNFIIS